MTITLDQADLINWTNHFKSNYHKGVERLKTILNVPSQAEALIKSPSALHVLLGNYDKQTPRLLDAIRCSPYADRIAEAFVKSQATTPSEFVNCAGLQAVANVASIRTVEPDEISTAFANSNLFAMYAQDAVNVTENAATAGDTFAKLLQVAQRSAFETLSIPAIDLMSPHVHKYRSNLLHLVGAVICLPINWFNGLAVPEDKQNLFTARLIDIAHDVGEQDESLGFTFRFASSFSFRSNGGSYNLYYYIRYNSSEARGIEAEALDTKGAYDNLANKYLYQFFNGSKYLHFIKKAKKKMPNGRGTWYTSYKTTDYPITYLDIARYFWFPNLREALGDGFEPSPRFGTALPGTQYEFFKTNDGAFIYDGNITLDIKDTSKISKSGNQNVMSSINVVDYEADYTEEDINASSSSRYLYLMYLNKDGTFRYSYPDTSYKYTSGFSCPCFCI